MFTCRFFLSIFLRVYELFRKVSVSMLYKKKHTGIEHFQMFSQRPAADFLPEKRVMWTRALSCLICCKVDEKIDTTVMTVLYCVYDMMVSITLA